MSSPVLQLFVTSSESLWKSDLQTEWDLCVRYCRESKERERQQHPDQRQEVITNPTNLATAELSVARG